MESLRSWLSFACFELESTTLAMQTLSLPCGSSSSLSESRSCSSPWYWYLLSETFQIVHSSANKTEGQIHTTQHLWVNLLRHFKWICGNRKWKLGTILHSCPRSAENVTASFTSFSSKSLWRFLSTFNKAKVCLRSNVDQRFSMLQIPGKRLTVLWPRAIRHACLYSIRAVACSYCLRSYVNWSNMKQVVQARMWA